MKALLFSILITLSVTAFAADSRKLEISGYSVSPFSGEGGEEFWMPDTKPLEFSRFALTNKSLAYPIIVTVLEYTNTEGSKKAFELSWRSRPAAPKEFEIKNWEGAHSWDTGYRSQTDVCLLKENYVISIYDMPTDFSDYKRRKLYQALAVNIAKTEPAVRTPRSP